MSTDLYDIAGIGFGPANIALSVYLEEVNSSATRIFFESNASPSWQKQMMLSGSDIQNNPLRDFVTPRNPKSHYTFINYLKQKGRLFEFLNLPVHYPLRREYAGYIEWVAGHFSDFVRFNCGVAEIQLIEKAGRLVWKLTGTDKIEYFARSVVIGTGRSPNIPAVFSNVLGSRVFHLTDFLKRVEALEPSGQKIAVIGSSQSAVEIILDLLKRFPQAKIFSIQRSFGFRLKDVSPFSDRVYFPEFIDYYYDLDAKGKDNLNRQLRSTNYSSADGDVLQSLYMAKYEDELSGNGRLHFINNTEVSGVRLCKDLVHMDLEEINIKSRSDLTVNAVALATGFLDLSSGAFGQKYPPLLGPVSEAIEQDDDGVIQVTKDYRVQFKDGDVPPLFLNGLCEASHGFGDAGSFSLLSVRSEILGNSLLSAVQPGFRSLQKSVRKISG